MKKIRILFLITDLGKGGAERFLVDHCSQLLQREDIEFKIGVLYDNNQYLEETKLFNIVKLNFDTFSFLSKNENESYRKLLDNFKPHIIHTNRYLAEFLSSYYLDMRIAYVCHGHDNMVEFKNLDMSTLFDKRKILNFFEKMYMWWIKYRKTTTYFIANSSHTQIYYQNVLPKLQRNNVIRIDYGFNYHKFQQNESRSVIPKRKLKILNVGSFQHKKNQTFIIDIANELLKYTANFEIHLIGNGQFFDTVKTRICKENLDKFVYLEGIQNNVQHWYRIADIYLHTAYYEPFGLVFLEAMAAGLPIVCLNGKGNKDIIEHEKNGFIFEKQNPKLFADAIFSLYEDDVLYEKISEYGKTYAKKFDLACQTEKFIQFYNSILEKN